MRSKKQHISENGGGGIEHCLSESESAWLRMILSRSAEEPGPAPGGSTADVPASNLTGGSLVRALVMLNIFLLASGILRGAARTAAVLLPPIILSDRRKTYMNILH